MKKFLCITSIFLTLFFLAGCASRTGGPAEVTDANALNANGSDPALARGLGHQDNLVGQDGGPQTGLLAKRSFYFKFDSNVVNRKDYPALKAHAKYLLSHSNAKVLIEGNTDSRGSNEYNIALGQRRADALKQILRMQGVSSRQVRTVSYGAERPIALGHTPADYQLNRRDDITYERN